MKNSFKLLIVAMFIINGYAMHASDDKESAELGRTLWGMHSYSSDKHVISPGGNNCNTVQQLHFDYFHASIPDRFDGHLNNFNDINSSSRNSLSEDSFSVSSADFFDESLKNSVHSGHDSLSVSSDNSIFDSLLDDPVNRIQGEFEKNPKEICLAFLKHLSVQEKKLKQQRDVMDHNFTGLHADMKQCFHQTAVYLKALNQSQEQLENTIKKQKREINKLKRIVTSQDLKALNQRQQQLENTIKKQKREINKLKRIITSQEMDIQTVKRKFRDLSENVATNENGDQSDNKYNTRSKSERKTNSLYNDSNMWLLRSKN